MDPLEAAVHLARYVHENVDAFKHNPAPAKQLGAACKFLLAHTTAVARDVRGPHPRLLLRLAMLLQDAKALLDSL